MSAQLMAEVRAFLKTTPLDLKPADRTVLLLLAEASQPMERADWAARTCGTPVDELARLVGVTPAGLARVLQRLRDQGLEVRVQIGTTRHGAPQFAKRGTATDFRLPDLPMPTSDESIARTVVRAVEDFTAEDRADDLLMDVERAALAEAFGHLEAAWGLLEKAGEALWALTNPF
jgi:hypothetical protein